MTLKSRLLLSSLRKQKPGKILRVFTNVIFADRRGVLLIMIHKKEYIIMQLCACIDKKKQERLIGLNTYS